MAKKKAARPAARKAKAGIRNARQASAAKKKAARPATRTAGARARKVGTKRPTASGGRGAASRKSPKTATRVTKKTARAVTKPARRAAGAATKRTKRAVTGAKKGTIGVARPVARSVTAAKKPARQAVQPKVAVVRSTVKKTPARAVQLPLAPAAAPRPKRPPTLDRARKVIAEPSTWAGPPSSLDFDRHASAARTGRDELEEKLHNHTSTSPALSAGDIDADWASAESSGDETPGGDNPTPDQDVVDEIGRALGVEYDDNEELQGGVEILERDRHRWELDPASKEDPEPEEPED